MTLFKSTINKTLATYNNKKYYSEYIMVIIRQGHWCNVFKNMNLNVAFLFFSDPFDINVIWYLFLIVFSFFATSVFNDRISLEMTKIWLSALYKTSFSLSYYRHRPAAVYVKFSYHSICNQTSPKHLTDFY